MTCVFDARGFKYSHKYKDPKFIGYVYELICLPTECVYVGKAYNMRPVSSQQDYTRISQHFTLLKEGKHSNIQMQMDWVSTNGDIVFSILEEYDLLAQFTKLSDFERVLKHREKEVIRARFDAGIDLYNKLIPLPDLSRFTIKHKTIPS